MAKSTFEQMKGTLNEACEFLRSFTLGRQGFTRSDGVLQRLERPAEPVVEFLPRDFP